MARQRRGGGELQAGPTPAAKSGVLNCWGAGAGGTVGESNVKMAVRGGGARHGSGIQVCVCARKAKNDRQTWKMSGTRQVCRMNRGLSRERHITKEHGGNNVWWWWCVCVLQVVVAGRHLNHQQNGLATPCHPDPPGMVRRIITTPHHPHTQVQQACSMQQAAQVIKLGPHRSPPTVHQRLKRNACMLWGICLSWAWSVVCPITKQVVWLSGGLPRHRELSGVYRCAAGVVESGAGV